MNSPNSSQAKEEFGKLKDYIENRKALLEEEIEETIHQALADAKDSLELIRENIDPKVDKIVRDKMEFIDNKMENWKKDFRLAAHEEVRAGADNLSQKTLDGLDGVVEEKINALKEDLRKLVLEEVKTAVAPGFRQMEETTADLKNKALIALAVSALALIGVVVLKLAG